MFWLDNPSGVPAMPPLKAVHSATKLWFTEGGNGTSPSYPGEDWFNIVSAELLYLLEKAGITPQKGTLTQLAAAVEALSVKSTRDLLIGIPLPWPSLTPPTGAMFLTGQALTQSTDPKLYALYGANIIDARAEILRGLDMGRGVDTGRALFSAQGDAMRNVTGATGWLMGGIASDQASGVMTAEVQNTRYPAAVTGSGTSAYRNIHFDISSQVPTASEIRMRNIALPFMTYRG